jgi:endonuclease III
MAATRGTSKVRVAKRKVAKKGGAAKVSAPSKRVKTSVTRAERAAARAMAPQTFEGLRRQHPDAHCELDHRNAFELLVATVLSAQTTDVLVNKTTPALFRAYPDAERLAAADPGDVMGILSSHGLGMYRVKTKSIIGLAARLRSEHGGRVPETMAELVELPGVGRKTANVVLGVAFGCPDGVVVDTHVQRLAQRLGWTGEQKPELIEKDLCKLFPREHWDPLAHTLIFHGRRVCFAQRPACSGCQVSALCPSAFAADRVGRKPPRSR